jgi:hypothetical protein
MTEVEIAGLERAMKNAPPDVREMYAKRIADARGVTVDSVRKSNVDTMARSLAGRRKSRIVRLARPADPRGKNWRPRYTGTLDHAVFPKYGLVPSYVPSLLPLMGKTLRGAIIAIGGRVDRDGAFTMPRHVLAKLLDVSRWVAADALDLLEQAGVIQVLYQGERRQATVWRYVPVAAHDAGRARRVLAGAKAEATDRVAEA